MAFRFRKIIKLFPGVRLNISKSGLSTTFGGPGAAINIGKRGTRGTIGLPGSGMSYSTMLSGGRRRAASNAQDPDTSIEPDAVKQGSGGCIGILLIGSFIIIMAIAFIGGQESTPPTSTSDIADSELANPSPTDPSSALTRTVTAANVNCRATPSASGKIGAKTGAKETKVIELSRQNGWVLVQLPDAACWISDKFIK